MNLILTMAGKYSRFLKEGYRIPKYLLPWGNKSILCEIIENLNHENVFKNIYLIANKNDEIFMPHVKDIMQHLNIPLEHLILIKDTTGQAQTARLAIEHIQDSFGKIHGPIVFHNVDTILYRRDFSVIEKKLKEYDGLIDTFESNNRNYSYVIVENEEVESIAEKVVISNQATSGFYAFRSSDIFLKFYNKNENYISFIYKRMITNKCKISTGGLYAEKDTVVLGTPSEYQFSSYLVSL